MIGVVVPVMRRPQNAAPFMESLAASGAAATVYAVADADDSPTIEAWISAGATVLLSGRGRTFANKAQHAYLNTDEAWLLLIGDDVEFTPGWLGAAEEHMVDEVSLISTNDVGNSYVRRGMLAIHPIIRRSWVDESGASWDGPGHIAHEGYQHGRVDWEWSTKALDDGVFRYVPECVIRHQHWAWKRSKRDDVYRLGAKHRAADKALYLEREAKHRASCRP